MVLSIADNLVKDVPGQMVQCTNLVFRLDELASLSGVELLP